MPIRPTKKGRALIRSSAFKKSLGKRISAVSKRLRDLVEKKHHDVSDDFNFANDNSVRRLSTMAQGDTSATRSGLKVSAGNLYLRYGITWAAGASSSPPSVRMIVFIDKNPQGAIASITDLLESADTKAMYNNIYEGKRFVVLYDKIHNNPNPSTTVDCDMNYYKKLKINRNVFFLDSTSTNTALGANNICYLALGDNTTASGNAPAYSLESRLYYTDM